MQHQPNDYTAAPYYNYPPPPIQNPNTAFAADHANPYASASASAPPLTSSYSPAAEFPQNYQNYPPYSQNSHPVPPTAPSNPNPSIHHSQYIAQYESHHAPQYYPPYDQNQNQNPTATNYAPVAPPNPGLNQSTYSQIYSSAPYSSIGSSAAGHAYDVPYENSPKFDQVGGYLDDRYSGGYNPSRVDPGLDYSGRRMESGSDYYGKRLDVGYDDGAYAYQGKVEPYGARGTVPKSSNSTLFDDYGRPIGSSNVKESLGSSAKIVRAVPKADTQDDVKSGVQKFRVKLLPESGSQSAMDVLCQVGLDGIRMLDPSTSRILRIYPLENITKSEVFDSSTFAFWSKSPVDTEARRIRLQSNRYTTSTLLDTVTAATVQFKEMGGRSRPVETVKTTEQTVEKKRGFGDWMRIIKPQNEEKYHWVPDEVVAKCTACGTDFGAFVRRHHCRNCGDIFCDKCTQGRIALTAEENAQPVRVCDPCMAEVTHRLSTANGAANRSASFQSHEDLAKKLQEEMERNRKASSGSKSDGSGRRMKEVACPICTVHLQVQVPTSGSETIECGVCQHPFLVSAR